MIVAALLSVAQVTAAAEDVYIEESSNGKISYSVSSSVVTLTVSPATDYYITVDDIVVQKTIDGGSLNSQRASGPGVASKLPLTPVNVDDTGKGTYTFNLIEGYGAYVTATFTECMSMSPSIEISDWIYGDTPVLPIVNGNTSKGDVTYYYKNVRDKDYGSTVPVNVGEYHLFAVIAAKGHYKSAKTSEIPFSITKAPLTITAKSYTIRQGSALPTFEATYEGFKNNETSAVLTKQPAITTATSASEPGEYEITISGAEAQNYEISYVKGKLTIVDADALFVRAKSYTIKYGDELPTFEFTSEGATIEGTPTISCEATSASPVGTYPIVITKGSVTHYNTTFVNGTLTIEKAPLKITAKSYTIKQGEELPTFEATYEGFKNNETSTVLTKQPAITTTATSASEPGEYEITISGAEAKNYEISYVKGKLTIAKADAVTVKAKSYTIKYGDELPKFEFTSEGATLKGTPEIKCEATSKSPVGTYTIVISKGSVTNYNDTYVNGTLTIEKAPLTITAKSYTIKQGEDLPTFEATYEGFKNNETSAVLTKQPTITTTATSASAPGEYEITISGAEAQNYEISYVAGKLTIEAVEIVPISETEEKSFSQQVDETTDLQNTVIDNTYYNMDATNGDGYDATEQALVLNSTTSSAQMSAVQGAQVGDAAVRENFSGIIFEIPAGQGVITVDAKTIGTHVLNVQIGNGAPTQVKKTERGTAEVEYNVSAPTYVYLYASTESGASARLYRGPSAGANSVLLYGYKVQVGGTGIGELKNGKMEELKYYDLNGRKVKTPRKGVYIINGKKVVVK